MSNEEKTTQKREHGTTKSYVIGFILSLIFTFIPFYLVDEHVITGRAILVTILGFAVIQMIIQVFFFLHLGREKKPYWQRWFLMGTIGGIFVVVGGSLWIMSHLHYNMTPVTPEDAALKLVEDEGIAQIGGEKTGACEGQNTTYKVTIKDGIFTPNSTNAKQCDKLTFINEDDDAHYIMFGSFEQPRQYAGEDMLTVTNRRSKTIILNEPGAHQYHNHSNPDASGQFVVEP